MDRDLWMTSSKPALGPLLASQADMDDVLRAATTDRIPKRRGFRRLRRHGATEQHKDVTVESLTGEVEHDKADHR